MNERDALLQAVCDNPDDDTPRLVFADWLQENGEEERAEFIRLQIEIAGLSDGKKKQMKLVREKELLNARGDEWLEPFREYSSPSWRGKWWEFVRGFVEGLAVDEDQEEDFYTASPSVFARTPLRSLWLTNQQDFTPISRWNGLTKLTELVVEGAVLAADTEIGKLFRSRYVANVQTLRLIGFDDNGHLDLPAVEELAGRTGFRGLKRLDLSCNWASWQFGEQAWVRVLSRAPLLSRLTRLDLCGTAIHAEGVEIIASSPRVANLKHLDLSANEIGERGARALLDSAHLARLQVLDLREIDKIGDQEDAVTPATREKLVTRFGDRVRLDPD